MSDKPISPLRQHMIDDMTARQFGEDTQRDYVRAVRNFTAFLGRSPDTATSDDLRRYQLHTAQQQISPWSINAAIAALRFFFKVMLERPDLVRLLRIVNEPRKAPVVLSQEEVARLLEAAPGLKYKAALSVVYGAGLRVSEIAHLKVSDIDSDRMTLRVGCPVRLSHPADALRAGLVYMPPDRNLEGLWPERSPVWNIATAPLRRCAAWRWPGSGWLGRLARDRMAQVSVRPTMADAPVRHLSGGNQQRVLFARSLEQAPAVLLLSDPTRGVDVRAKSDIHKLIETLAADGIAVCLTCSGIDEVLALAQRIVRMRAGRIVADGPRGTFDEARALAIVSSGAAAPS